MIPTLYNVKQAADKLNVNRAAIYELLKIGKLKGLRITQHNIRIEEEEILRYIDALRNEQSIREQAINTVFHNRRRQA